MNAKRRTSLLNLQSIIEDVKEKIEGLLEEEEEARDNIPESLQNSERYERTDAACDNLSNAIDALEEVSSYIEEAITQ